MFILCSFNPMDKAITTNINIEKYERLALQSNKAGKEYVVDLTGIEGCNKSRVKYLGLVSTQKGKKYKVLTSFDVHGSNCRGTSNIKIYDATNKFVGHYYVGMPNDLPDTLIRGRLVYFKIQEECPLRKGTSINLLNGLPKRFFLPCSQTGGDEYVFSD
jgi:hypothetical protein